MLPLILFLYRLVPMQQVLVSSLVGCCTQFLNAPLASHRPRFKIGVLIPIDRTQYPISENREEFP